MFAVYAAECVRTKPHVKESYQKIDRSSIDIPWKFNDWNEAAKAGKNLPIDSGYGQFRAMCRDSVSELISEISAHTGHNPVLGFPEEEITEFFVSGEPLMSDSVDKITSEVFGYLYNQEQHSRLNSSKPTEIAAPEQPAEQFTLFGDNEFTIEEPQADELPDESLNRAAAYIKDYFEQEFGSAAEIEDPSHVDLAYTTDEENDAVTKYMMSDDYQEYKSRAVGELNDFKIVLMHQGALVSLSLKANGHYTCDYSMSGLGGVTRLCNLYDRIPEQIHGLNAELEQAKKQLSNAKEQYGKPFQYEEQLRAGLERQAQINAELEVADKPHDEAVMSDYSDDENEEMEM